MVYQLIAPSSVLTLLNKKYFVLKFSLYCKGGLISHRHYLTYTWYNEHIFDCNWPRNFLLYFKTTRSSIQLIRGKEMAVLEFS